MIAYQPRRSLRPSAHVDQAWAVTDLGVKVRAAQKPARVCLAPEKTAVDCTFADGYVDIKLPQLEV